MHDREKVTGHLNDCLSASRSDNSWVFVRKDIVSDALALMKEQEAVEPVKKDMVEVTSRYEYDCQCGAPLLIGQPYCADCGRAVKWDV